MKESRSQSFRMNSLQDESSGTKTSQSLRMNSLGTSPVGQTSSERTTRLHGSRLGLKTLDVLLMSHSYGTNSRKCWLNVFTARGIGLNLRPQTEQILQTHKSQPESWQDRTLLGTGLTRSAAALLGGGFYWFRNNILQREQDSPPETRSYTSAAVESSTTETNQL
ncbi:hypothetical protein FQN60_006422 [Etheostoma spectabile]|uniref:Uncharacterized protein n=1 Tax=Etheostoma spectabile TaxID=54343 RepID=A0A5J5CTH8_9PERO|nr:hypothetical protein FQN60_006422 [Etheostoma spectabile]